MNILLKKILLIFTLVGVSSVLIACRPTEEMSKDVKITPSEFFQGDTALLEPHLKMTASAVNLDYTGDKENLNLQYEIWEEGELTTDDEKIVVWGLTAGEQPSSGNELIEETVKAAKWGLLIKLSFE